MPAATFVAAGMGPIATGPPFAGAYDFIEYR